MTADYTGAGGSSDITDCSQDMVRELENTRDRLQQENKDLQQQLNLYTGMINAMPDVIVHTDLYGKILFVNDALVQSTGLKKSEIEGKNILAFLPAEERKKAIYNTMFMLEERSEPDEFKLVSENGKKIPFEINGDVFLDNSGKPSGFIFACRDISARRQAEKQLKTMEEQLRSITASLPGMIFQFGIDKDGNQRLYYISEQSRDFFDLHMQDLDELYNAFVGHIHAEDREGYLDSVVKAEKSMTSWNYTFRFIKPTGELVWLQGLSVPSFHEKELVFNGIILDISDFKLAEDMSRISEEKFLRVFMTVPDCVAITRLEDGYIINTNPAIERVTGWSRDEAVGHRSSDINFWGDPAERSFLKEKLSGGDEVINREFKFNRKDGSVRSGIYSARSLQIGNDECLVIVIQDVSALKQVESERFRLEQQLLQVQKMEAIGQLAGGVAHDFNNILSAIQGNVSLMLLKTRSEEYNYSRLLSIDESIRRGAELTRQLLGFARGGKYELKTVSVNEIIEKSIRFFIETRKNIETELKLQQNVFPVEADPGQLEQVLLNLYINAAQAMPAGGRIIIETFNLSIYDEYVSFSAIKEGNYVKISVTDTGTGMDKETLKRIFEPFFTTKSQAGGTGLGLASVYGIIRNHNGLINAYSEPGHGTTFNIYLPSTDKTVICEAKDNRLLLVRGSGVVLFVDDEQSIINTAAELLETLGYSVYTAMNGPDAIRSFSEKMHEIDLIIMDMIMPGISGTALLKKFRKIRPDIKIILTSGYSMQNEVQRAFVSGCQGFLQKPYRITDLAAMIHKTLDM